jgi:cell division transport system permease protein
MRANFIFSEVWIGLRRNLTMTFAVVLTVAVGMAMLGVGLLINTQVSMMKDFWYDKVEVSVFLCHKNTAITTCQGKGITDQQRDALKAKLEALPGVEQVIYEDQNTAFKNFKQTLSSNNLLSQVTKAEDMPTSFRIKLTDPDNYQPVVQAAQGQPGVAQVTNQRELIGTFFDMLDKLRYASLLVAITLTVAAALLIGNTVRLSAFNRRRETGIMRLVGASNIYIQLPFVMEGVIAGLIGGVIAAVMLILSKVFLFDGLAGYLSGRGTLGWDSVAEAITYTMLIGVVICVLASFITLRRYLRV